MSTARNTEQFVLVAVSDLRKGMYITDLRMSWLDHNFIRRRFLIEDNAVLAKLRSHSAKHQMLVDSHRSWPGMFDSQFDEESPVVEMPPPAEAFKAPSVPEPTNPAATRLAPPQGLVGVSTSLAAEIERIGHLVNEARCAIIVAMQDGRVGQITNLPQLQDIAQQMVESTARNQGALHSLTLLKTADNYTYTHCVAVGVFMISLGRTLGLSAEMLVQAGTTGLLHDVGKARIPETVLNKPGKLTPDEYEQIKTHPLIGEQMLKDSGYHTPAVLEAVRHHHERLDGKGYPDAQDNTNISLLSRMAAVTDVYDAVTSHRVYHAPLPPTVALQLLLKNAGTQFDGVVVSAFTRTIGIYPNGCIVKLKSGKLAIVKEQWPADLRKPLVRVFFSVINNINVAPIDIQLSQNEDSIVSVEHADTWGITTTRMAQLLDLPM